MNCLELSAGPASTPSPPPPLLPEAAASVPIAKSEDAAAAASALLAALTFASFLMAGDFIPELFESLEGFIANSIWHFTSILNLHFYRLQISEHIQTTYD